MANDLMAVDYEVAGAPVHLDADTVKRFLVRGNADLVTPQEVVFFLHQCKAQKLNPLDGSSVYLIKYSKEKPANLVVGKAAYLRRAFEHPDYLYKEDGITVMRGKEVIQKEGCCLYPGEQLVGAWCRVHFLRKGKECTAFREVALSEYNSGQANWKSKPATMLNKCAISQCVREAFPTEYQGLYADDEMVASGAIPVEYEDVTAVDKPKAAKESKPAQQRPEPQAVETVEAVQTEVVPAEVGMTDIISAEQRKTLLEGIKDFCGIENKDLCNDTFVKILNRVGLKANNNALSKMTVEQYEQAMTVLGEMIEAEAQAHAG